MSNDKESEQSSDIDLYDWFSVGDCLYEYECWRIYLVYGNIQPEFCRTISENRHKRGTVPGISRSAIILALIGMTRLRRIGSTVFLVWTGILCGVYFTCAVMNHGVSGVLFCVVGLLPHMACYLFAYGILFMTIFFYPKKQWNYEKTIAFCLAICMGIALEYKANPVLVKMILKRI